MTHSLALCEKLALPRMASNWPAMDSQTTGQSFTRSGWSVKTMIRSVSASIRFRNVPML
jgi:hypothetical protein